MLQWNIQLLFRMGFHLFSVFESLYDPFSKKLTLWALFNIHVVFLVVHLIFENKF